MWTKILTFLVTDKRARHMILAVVASILFLAFMLIYAVIATPWTMLTGWFDSIFQGGDIYDNIDWNGNFSMQDLTAYQENYGQLATNHINTLTAPYLNHWKSVMDKSKEVAARLGRENAKVSLHPCSEPCCGAEYDAYAVVYSTFANGSRTTVSAPDGSISIGDCDAMNIMDIGVIISYFNNVGLEWDWYEQNYPEVLDLMDVPKDPATGEYVHELASVDTEKLVKLIQNNKDKFFVEHIPQSDGSCNLGAACTAQHQAHFVDVGDRSNLPETYMDLVTMSHIQEPYFGIYYSKWCSEHTETNSDDTTYICHTYHTDYTAVGFVEYRGFEFFRELLHLDEVPGAMNRVGEAYSNLRDIIGIESSAEYSLQLDAVIESYEPYYLRNYYYPGAQGSATQQPIRFADGSYPTISAGFNDAGYAALLGYQHWGVDFSVGVGTPVRATSLGVVVTAQTTYVEGKGFGRYVMTYQGRNAAGDRYYFIYAHLNSVAVSEGSIVTASTIIGTSGRTGNVTGPHLHYECRVHRANGTIESIDPFSAEVGMVLGEGGSA